MPFVQANGIQICWEDRGHGEPIVLINGIATPLNFWPGPFCNELAAAGFRVVRFDNRDVGRSAHLNTLPPPRKRELALSLVRGGRVKAPYTLDDMATDTVGLLDGLGLGAAHIVGMSMGGMIAQLVALQHPTRVLSLTTMMSTPGERRVSRGTPRALRALVGRVPRSRDELILHHIELFRVLNGPHFPFDESFVKVRAIEAWERGFSVDGAQRQLAAILASGNRLYQLAALDVPTLVIHGTRDPLIPAVAGAATAGAIPGARLMWVEGMGHDLVPQVYSQVATAITEHALRATSRGQTS